MPRTASPNSITPARSRLRWRISFSKQQDAAGVVTFSNKVESFMPPRSKRDYLLQIIHALENRGAAGETNVAKILEELAGQIRRRGLIVLISDLLDEPEQIIKGLRQFRFKGNDVIVFHLLDQAEFDLPFDGNILFEDLEAANSASDRRSAHHPRYL
jgi:uncharacterized protein (DUF58 family)